MEEDGWKTWAIDGLVSKYKDNEIEICFSTEFASDIKSIVNGNTFLGYQWCEGRKIELERKVQRKVWILKFFILKFITIVNLTNA